MMKHHRSRIVHPACTARAPVCVLAALLLTSAAPALAQVGPAWESWGPAPINDGEYTGRVAAIVCSPTDPDRYFIGGADGGVWRTTDGGANWTPLTDAMPTTAIGALALDPADENIIYAGTGEANFANHSRFGLGIFKSTDGGDTWIQLAESTFAGRCISRIVVSHADSSVVYAAVTQAGGFPAKTAAKGHPQADDPVGVFKSIDGGETWTQLTGTLPAVAATDFAMKSTNADVIYAAIGHIFGHTDNGVYKSTDGGESWTKLAGGLPTTDVGRISLAVTPAGPSRLYAAITSAADSNGGSAELRGVYRSTDNGNTWTPLGIGNYMATYGWYLNVVAANPTDAQTVMVGGLSMHRSTNGGTNWFDITPPHVDLHAIAWDAAGRLLAGDDGGVHRSTDQGNSWVPLNDGLGLVQLYAGLSLDPNAQDVLYGGMQDNGSNKRTGPNTWSNIFGGDGGWTQCDQNNANIVFCEFQGTANLYRSTNGGDGFNWSGSGISSGDRNCFLPPYEIDPNNSQRMIYGTHRVYASINGGSSWTAISGDLTTGMGAIRSIAFAPSNAQTIWVTTNDGNVQATFNSGGLWSLKRSGLPGWVRVMRQVTVHPEDHMTAFLAGSRFATDQVLSTTDGGTTWQPLDGDIPDVPVNVIALDTRPATDVLFAGMENGVYRSIDGGANWFRFGLGLPNTAVVDLRVDVEHSRLLASTQGRGVWRIPIWLPGDINDDGAIDEADVALFVEVLLGFNTDEALVMRSDVNGDGAPDGDDVTGFVAAMGG